MIDSSCEKITAIRTELPAICAPFQNRSGAGRSRLRVFTSLSALLHALEPEEAQAQGVPVVLLSRSL